MKYWIKAFRLRTLPLALSSVIVGCGMAFSDGVYDLKLTLLLISTTLLLQVLSNLANDYGDFVKGVDNHQRVGPERALQSGKISKSQMVIAIMVVAILCAVSGLTLIVLGTKNLGLMPICLFVILGLISIIAAINYSVGKYAYGYAGLGDLAVFLFFGWLGVLGSYYLLTHRLEWSAMLPATSIGLLSTAVLNINNMRDHVEDKKCGKHTLAVKLGINKARIYHLLINFCAVVLISIYKFSALSFLGLLLLGGVLFIIPAIKICFSVDHEQLDPFLKRQAMGTFIYSIAFALILYIGRI